MREVGITSIYSTGNVMKQGKWSTGHFNIMFLQTASAEMLMNSCIIAILLHPLHYVAAAFALAKERLT
jgi:hypothetical protein